MHKLFIVLLCLFSTTVQAFKYDLSICALFQDEARFMKEWLEYHRLVGVEHFWLYNNGSIDNYRDILNPYIEKGIIDLIDWPTAIAENEHFNFVLNIQPMIYNDGLERSRGVSKWLAIIDLDEFIVPVQCDSVAELLERDYPLVSGLCVNWQSFGTSYVQEIFPNELMIEKLIMKMPTYYYWHNIYKTIVQPLHVKSADGPHACNYLRDHFSVHPDFSPSYLEKIVIDKIRINHYWTRDEKNFWQIKVPRYQKWGPTSNTNGMGVVGHAQMMNEEQDLIIQRFVGRLKEYMLD